MRARRAVSADSIGNRKTHCKRSMGKVLPRPTTLTLWVCVTLLSAVTSGQDIVTAEGKDDLPAAGQDDVLVAGQHDVPATGQDNVTAARQQDVPAAGQHDVPAAGQDDVPAAGQDDVTAAGQQDVPAVGQQDVPATGQHDIPAAGQDDVPAAGQHDVPAAGQHDVPAAGQDDVTAAGQQDVPAAGQQDVPATGQHDIPAAGQDDVPAAGQHDVPAAGQDDVTAAGQQDVPAAGQQDVPATGQHDIPAAGQDNVTAAGQEDVPVAGQQDVPATGQHDVPAPGQDDVAAAEVAKLDITTVANKAVDFMLKLFKTTKSIVDRLTPLVINVEIPFPKGKVYDFQLYNLPDLERRGDINMSLHLLSGNATLGGGLGLTKILVGSKYSYNPFWGLEMSGDVDVEIYDVAARMSFTVNIFKARGHFELLKFQEFGQVRVTRFTGATELFNWLGVLIMNKIIQTGSDLIRQKMDEKVKEYLTEVLESTKLPITVS